MRLSAAQVATVHHNGTAVLERRTLAVAVDCRGRVNLDARDLGGVGLGAVRHGEVESDGRVLETARAERRERDGPGVAVGVMVLGFRVRVRVSRCDC